MFSVCCALGWAMLGNLSRYGRRWLQMIGIVVELRKRSLSGGRQVLCIRFQDGISQSISQSNRKARRRAYGDGS